MGSQSIIFRSFALSFITQKAAKPPVSPKTKAGGFKLKKEEYNVSKKIAATKLGPLPESYLEGHHLLRKPHRELKRLQMEPELLVTRATGIAVSFPSGPGTIIGSFGVPSTLESEFLLLSGPTSVIRDATYSVIEVLDNGSMFGTSSGDSRVIITGDSGAGKSHLLLQAANYAAASKGKNWLVLYIPRAISWVNSTTPYIYDPRTKTFQQPELALQILRQFVSANPLVLKSEDIQLEEDIHSERVGAYLKGTPISALLNVGLKDQYLATEVLELTLEALGKQDKYSILLAVDEFQALFCLSKYRDPQYQLVFAHHLSIPRLILEYAIGERLLAKGAVLGAISTTDPRFRVPLPLKEVLGIIEPGSVSPYEQRHKDIAFYASGVKGLRVPSKMHISEATSMFDLWVQSNALHTPANDSLFLSKYVEASGNPREMVKSGLLSTLGTS